jgi:hypothetical protein
MSAFPLTQTKGTYSFDFTSGAGQAYGTNAQNQLAPDKWAVFSGDGDANNVINYADITGVWMPNAGKTGYLNADFNMNGQVNNQDKNNYCLPNFGQNCQVPQGDRLQLRAFLEGPYLGTEMSTLLISQPAFPLTQPYSGTPWNYTGTEQVTSLPNDNIVDWILVELRDAETAAQATPATRIARIAAFLLKDGSVVGMDGSSTLQFSNSINHHLFLVLWHKNHLGIMSALPLIQSGGLYSYDFTTGPGQAFGVNAQKQLTTGIWGMYSGDGDANNTINNTDKIGTWFPNVGKKGYLNADFNLNGQVNNQDKNEYWLSNVSKSCQVPQ